MPTVSSSKKARKLSVAGHLADHRARELPTFAGRANVADAIGSDDRDHALLRFGDHDLPRLEHRLAERHTVEVHVDAEAVRGHLRQRRREPGSTAVLQRDHEPALDELERDLDQRLAAERIADLDRRPLLVRAFEVLRRQDGSAADAVTTRQRTEQHERVADALRLRLEHPLGGQKADAHRVDERIGGVVAVERAFTADGGHADAVAVVRDPGDGLPEVPVRRAEAETVEQRHRPRAHRHDVAEDAADAGGGALKRLDGGRVVVRLDLERDGETVAEVEHAGVASGP